MGQFNFESFFFLPVQISLFYKVKTLCQFGVFLERSYFASYSGVPVVDHQSSQKKILVSNAKSQYFELVPAPTFVTPSLNCAYQKFTRQINLDFVTEINDWKRETTNLSIFFLGIQSSETCFQF